LQFIAFFCLHGGDIVIGILSIDFDYFINASSQARDMYFPKGSDEIPENKLKSCVGRKIFKISGALRK